MLVDAAVELEHQTNIDDLWTGLVAALRKIGFDHAIHISVNSEFRAAQVLCTIPGLYTQTPPEDDPFLHHACNSYKVLTIGAAFLHQHPGVSDAERNFITRAAREGLRAGFAVPMRLQGSDRFGGFIIGSDMDRETFVGRFCGLTEELRLFCLLMHRRIEDLTGTAPLPLPQQSSVFDQLSPREAEVVNLLAHGYSRQETAHHCGISVHTVSDYAKSGYRKLGIHNRAQAAALVHATSQKGAADKADG